MPGLDFAEIRPTPLLKGRGRKLLQLVRLKVVNGGRAAQARVLVEGGGRSSAHDLGRVQPGESAHEIFIQELAAPAMLCFTLLADREAAARRVVPLHPVRRWVVHVIQQSHHDVGYTDLPSHVLAEHAGFLDRVIDMAEETRGFPDEAQFRIMVEQAWSIDYFLRHAPPARAARMVALMRSGHVELTALFGNMVTELCGHETLARCAYTAFRIARQVGVPIVSAEHNDIPGFSWGVSQVLTEAGIKMFCPGLPLYYMWGSTDVPPAWDERAIFGREGVPGAFWWEAPTGKRVLFWCNNAGCGGDCRAALPGLAERLAQLVEKGYPWRTLRWPVKGGARDNSPYIGGYAQTVRDWNAAWVSPKLVLSTNARFYEDFIGEVGELPVVRGELPGQDYPVGVASTAAATAVNRANHADVPAAEALASAASLLSGAPYPAETLSRAYEEVLWHDEHTWGHHFPCGPAARASDAEKALRAFWAETLAHDVASKAMARIADSVRLRGDGIHLVVFNPLPEPRTGPVAAPLREMENTGSTFMEVQPKDDPAGCGYLCGVALGNRWHVNPPPEIVAGRFDLVDAATGDAVPYQLVDIESPLGPDPFAARRVGLAGGGKRYGFFEDPAGIKRNLCFTAADVPALGYRTYQLAPRADCPKFRARLRASRTVLENDFYRIRASAEAGAVVSIYDKEARRELVDASAEHPFGSLVVRNPLTGTESVSNTTGIRVGKPGPICSTMTILAAAEGHPAIETNIALFAGLKRIDWAVHVLKSPEPLLDAHVAFPFRVPGGRFRYEGVLCVLTPLADFMPGAYADRLVPQNWVKVTDGDLSVLWSSVDAPTVSLGRLWPGRVSQAHCCRVPDTIRHARQRAEDLRGGWIYSCAFANNFGTNFCISQTGDVLLRYVIASRAGDVADGDAAAFGQDAVTPFRQIFTKHPGPRILPPVGSAVELDNRAARLLALKRAEDGRGWILRLWNPTAERIRVRVKLSGTKARRAALTDLVERDTGGTLPLRRGVLTLEMAPRAVVTVRLIG